MKSKLNFNIHNESFEELLREAADNFTMQPSRRVWTSIYNNIHPGRKWPSFTACFFIMFSIILAGRFNTTATEQKSNVTVASNEQNPLNAVGFKSVATAESQVRPQFDVPSTSSERMEQQVTLIKTNKGINNQSIQQSAFVNQIRKLKLSAKHQLRIIPSQIEELIVEQEQSAAINSTALLTKEEKKQSEFSAIQEPEIRKDKNIAFQFYATPSYGYRFMNRNNPEVLSTSSFLSNAGPVEEIFSFQQAPSLNLEAGGSVMVPLNEGIRLKAGMQFNYTNYKVLGEELPYPFYTNMQLNQPAGGSVLEAHWSEFTNVSNISTGGNLLNNNSYQISMPVGTDFKILGNGSLRWYAGATLQPSYFISSNPFLISADMKNYVNDPDFVRKWNLNTSFETFVSYRLKNGATLNAGPQIRYQIFSTYNSKYIYDERLYNIGIKMGITPNF